MKTKTKKNYRCLCGLDFGNRKDHWERHINRINPCEALLNSTTQNTQFITQNTQNTQNEHSNTNIPLCVEINTTDDKKTNIYPCEFCKKVFSRKFNLDRHLITCKTKLVIEAKPIEQIAQHEHQKLSEPNNIKIDIIMDRLNHLENENEKLKKQIKKTKKTKSAKTINSHNKNVNIEQQNIVNNNIVVNFNDMRLEDVDKKLFIQPIMNTRLYGKAIILQMIENIYINEAHPEYQNFIITDKNRGYIKIYNEGKWKTDDIQMINFVIDGIITESKNILVELKQKYINNNPAQNRLDTSEKYINLCDLEYLEDLEDAQENDGVNNTAIITRCKEFREMVYKDTINIFHDNKDLLLKSKNKNNKIIELY